MGFRVFQFTALLLIASSLFQVSRSLSGDTETEADGDFDMSESLAFLTLSPFRMLNGDAGHNHTMERFDFQRKLLGVSTVEPSPMDTSCIFPNNSDRLFLPGKEYKFLIEVKNNGKSELAMFAIFGRVYLPNTRDSDHLVDELEPQTFTDQRVRPLATWTFTYNFFINKDLKAGKYDLVGNILYFMDHTPIYATFFDDTIEVVETALMLVGRAAFYIILGVLLWQGCILLYQKREDRMNAKRAQEEAEAEAEAEEEWWIRRGETVINMDQSTSYSRSKKKSKNKAG